MVGSLLSSLPVFLQMWDGRHMGGDWGFGAWLLMGAFMLLFWGSVVAIVVWLARGMSRPRPSGPSPLDIARERYARGELNDEEFQRIKRGLQ